MQGIIIFADDDVLNREVKEYLLFERFRKEENLTVIPVTNLIDLKRVVSSASTFKALILDWSFKIKFEEDGMPDKNETPKEILKNNNIYSLIYIYSRETIPDEEKEEIKKFCPASRIRFNLKNSDINNIEAEYNRIISEIEELESANKHMEVPYVWSQSINQAVQSIFYDLENANPHWLAEIRDNVKNDGGDPTSEIIDILQNILSEQLVQMPDLRKALEEYNEAVNNGEEKELITARLYRRIMYTKLHKDAPIMTGDIFKFDETDYGILITPECEIRNRKYDSLEFLCFSRYAFNYYLRSFSSKDVNHEMEKTWYTSKTNSKKKSYRDMFNNGDMSKHFLPSFPFDEDNLNETCYINFKKSLDVKSIVAYSCKRTGYKLNAPYIHQLRQRFVSFFGKYGVSDLPESLRDYNLNVQ